MLHCKQMHKTQGSSHCTLYCVFNSLHTNNHIYFLHLIPPYFYMFLYHPYKKNTFAILMALMSFDQFFDEIADKFHVTLF